MSTVTERTTPARTKSGTRLGWGVADAFVLMKRNVLRFVRIPALLVFSIVQPLMFVLLFVYVLGGNIKNLPGIDYVQLPDARHLRPDRHLRLDEHRHRARRGPRQRYHRPLPLVADGALRRARRADPRGPRPQHRGRRADGGGGLPGRLLVHERFRLRDPGDGTHRDRRVRVLVGVRLHRPRHP